MANSATNMYTVNERPTLNKPIKSYKIAIDTANSDLVIHTPDTDKSCYLKSVFFSETSATNPTWKQRSTALTGTVATTNASATITGTNTTFTTDYTAGDEIVITDGNTLTVQSVDSNTQITATGSATSTVSGKTHKKQQTFVTPELSAYQGMGNVVQFDSWILATAKGYALVMAASVAISSMLVHVLEAKPD